MITYLKGDIFNSPAQVITNTVNTEGVMGKGLALEFKKRYPQMFEVYREACKKGQFEVGNLMFYKENEKTILLFPTKKEWRRKSELSYIEAGLKKFVDNWDSLGISSVAFPKLGCGNGGLEWPEVKALMEKYLKKLPIDIYVYTDQFSDKARQDEISDIEKWLKSDNTLLGYAGFKKELQTYLNKNNDSVQIESHHFSYSDGLEVDGIRYDDDIAVRAWAYVRDAKFLATDEIERSGIELLDALVLLMLQIDYVCRVYVSKDGINYTKEPNGYQYLAA